jgi:hypothetical protein
MRVRWLPHTHVAADRAERDATPGRLRGPTNDPPPERRHRTAVPLGFGERGRQLGRETFVVLDRRLHRVGDAPTGPLGRLTGLGDFLRQPPHRRIAAELAQHHLTNLVPSPLRGRVNHLVGHTIERLAGPAGLAHRPRDQRPEHNLDTQTPTPYDDLSTFSQDMSAAAAAILCTIAGWPSWDFVVGLTE